MDWHMAARLIDPKRFSKLTSLAGRARRIGLPNYHRDPAKLVPAANTARSGRQLPGVSLSDGTLKAVQAHGEGITASKSSTISHENSR